LGTERVTAPYGEDRMLVVLWTIRSAELIDQAKQAEAAGFEAYGSATTSIRGTTS